MDSIDRHRNELLSNAILSCEKMKTLRQCLRSTWISADFIFLVAHYIARLFLIINNLILTRGSAMNVICPQCKSTAYKKNGYTRHGKQNHRCLECGRQFSVETEEEMPFEIASSLISIRIEERQVESFC
jgi:hypothetical protein